MNRRVTAIGLGVLVLVVLGAAVVRWQSKLGVPAARGESAQPAKASRGSAVAEPTWVNGRRITVEVLNATKVRGLARRAAMTLRDGGFDVVSTGTNPDQFDSTMVLARTGHRDWAERAAKAMGGGAVFVRPDSSRIVDLTVLVGSSWHPPAQPFYP